MKKFTFRIGSFGVAAACFLFAAVLRWGRTPEVDRLLTIFWPTSLLLAPGPGPGVHLGAGEIVKVAFSALMNGAAYSGVAWLVWWAAYLLRITKTGPTPREHFVSGFVAIGLGFTVLAAVVELAVYGLPKLSGVSTFWLGLVNLYALMAISCASAGWSMWWLRNYYLRRQGAHSAAPHGGRKSRRSGRR